MGGEAVEHRYLFFGQAQQVLGFYLELRCEGGSGWEAFPQRAHQRSSSRFGKRPVQSPIAEHPIDRSPQVGEVAAVYDHGSGKVRPEVSSRFDIRKDDPPSVLASMSPASKTGGVVIQILANAIADELPYRREVHSLGIFGCDQSLLLRSEECFQRFRDPVVNGGVVGCGCKFLEEVPGALDCCIGNGGEFTRLRRGIVEGRACGSLELHAGFRLRPPCIAGGALATR